MKENTNQLEASEFIINDRGGIYHLDLRPDEIADTIITVGDPARVKKVSQYFDTIDVKRKHREFKTHTGWLNDRRISVVSTGIGTDNIDIVMNEIDALFNIDFETRKIKKEKTSVRFIRLGTSGALQSDIKLDSFVVNTGAIGLEGLAFYYQETFQEKTQSGIPYYYTSCNQYLLDLLGHGATKGVALTAAGFYGPQGRSLRLSNHFKEDINILVDKTFDGHRISNMEMETAGIYYLANLLGHQAISFNAILANRVTGSFSTNPGETIDRLIRKVIQELRME